MAYEEALIPKKSQKTCTRVVKYYWHCLVLVVAHIFIFFGLTQTVQYCQEHIQTNPETGAQIQYGDPGYQCNTFQDNGWIITFYIFVCFYFFFSAYQMRVGLPELRKGSFMVD